LRAGGGAVGGDGALLTNGEGVAFAETIVASIDSLLERALAGPVADTAGGGVLLGGEIVDALAELILCGRASATIVVVGGVRGGGASAGTGDSTTTSDSGLGGDEAEDGDGGEDD